MIHDFWAGRLSPYLAPRPVVVRAVTEEPAPASLLMDTTFADTGTEVEAAEAVVLARLAELIGGRLSPLEAARLLFAGESPGCVGAGGPPASTVAGEKAVRLPE